MVGERSAFRSLNLSVFLHFLGRQLYSVFVPVMMLRNGFSLDMVLLFLVLSSVVTIFSSWVGQRYLRGRNVLVFNVVAVLSEISLLVLLSFGGFSGLIFTGIFLFEGFYYAFYYLSYWSITTHYTSKENTGDNLGNLTITVALASIIGPLLGSTILDGSQLMLNSLAAIVLLLSLLPILKVSKPEVRDIKSGKIKVRDIVEEIAVYSIAASFEVILFVLWSIYAYINNYSLLNVGFIFSAIAVARIIISTLIKSKLNEKSFRKKVMTASTLGIMATSIYRYYLPEHIILTNLLMATFYVVFQLGAQTKIINQFKGSQTYYSSMLLQINTFTTRIIVYILALTIGLKNIILFPLIAGIIYLMLNLRNFNH